MKITPGFGERIVSVRKERRLSGRALAEKLGMANVTVSKYERELLKPSIETFKKLAEILGVTPEYLSFGDEPPTVKSAGTTVDMAFQLCKKLSVDSQDLKELELLLLTFATQHSAKKTKPDRSGSKSKAKSK